MFRDRPELAAELLGGLLGLAVPAFDRADVSSGELTDIAPTEYRADLVVTFANGDTTVRAVVVEAQLQVDTRKRRSWPAYVGTLYARFGCPVVLLVLCPTPAVAVWCATPILVGDPGMMLTPVVLGPDQVPVVTEPELAKRAPQLTVLSAIAHSKRPDHKLVLEALLTAL